MGESIGTKGGGSTGDLDLISGGLIVNYVHPRNTFARHRQAFVLATGSTVITLYMSANLEVPMLMRNDCSLNYKIMSASYLTKINGASKTRTYSSHACPYCVKLTGTFYYNYIKQCIIVDFIFTGKWT